VKALAIILLAAVVSAPRPKPPMICVDEPVLESYLCQDSDTAHVFTERDGCEGPKVVAQACTLIPEDPETIAPAPPVDPDFDEDSPTGPVDGPGEGPGEGTPADRPAP
jgi:hypothetical protein